jgi:hypothetical protein
MPRRFSVLGGNPNAILAIGQPKHYHDIRLNSAVGYIAPKEMLAVRQQEIHAERYRKLKEARKQRQIRRKKAA